MDLIYKARIVANYISSLKDFEIYARTQSTYNHMGAVISDAILQAGLNYHNVVKPRIQKLLNCYPDARTTSGFLKAINVYSLNVMLNWDHPEKPKRIKEIAQLFYNLNIEIEDSLRVWINQYQNQSLLLTIKGIGPKTVDYLKMLVGLPSIAIDRHIKEFSRWLGIEKVSYYDTQKIFSFAADLLNINRSDLDFSVWSYVRQKKYVTKIHKAVCV